MGLFGFETEFISALVPLTSLILISLMISISGELDMISFLGVTFTLGIFTITSYKICRTIYDTWIGVLLGHNINLRRMGKWAVVTGGAELNEN